MLKQMLFSGVLVASVHAGSVGAVIAQESAYFGANGIIIAQEPGTAVTKPQSQVSMFCSTSAGGPGFVLVTLSNLTTSTIAKGKTLFAKKGGTTIQFQTTEDIPNGGAATYRTDASAFQVEGACDGWH